MTRIYNDNNTLNAYNISGFEIRPNDRYGYKIVAVVWDEDSWCAFRGLTDWDDEYVKASGEEIPYEVAKYLFPTIASNIPTYENW
jgi:hypothetical protein